MVKRGWFLLALAAAAGLLAACAPQATAPPEVGRRAPADFPDAFYRQARAQGKLVYGVDPARSIVVIDVLRGGSLAQFGHDHVVASREVAGYIAPDGGRADLYVPLGSLVVDEPALRAEAGFTTQPSAADIEGTRANMLTKVLETGRFPYAQIAVSGAMLAAGTQRNAVALSLHGATATMDVPVAIERTADGAGVSVSGKLALLQSRFGIVPFSILGGAIAVQDGIELSFKITARRME